MFADENLAWKEHLPDGWGELYLELLTEISALDPGVKVTQAKEKFGELRVYVSRADQTVHERIDAASRVSRRTCQTCGAAALLCVKRGLFATLCERHRNGFRLASSDPVLASLRVSESGIEAVHRDSLQFDEEGQGDDSGG